MRLNRFYPGELPDGVGGWIPGVHEPLIPLELFEAALKTREARRRSINTLTVCNRYTTYSLSGLCICGYCGERLHIHRDRKARPRIYRYQGRWAITSQLERLKGLYEWGDIQPAEYQAKRDTLQGELRGLTPEVEQVDDWGTVAAYLKDLSRAWLDATDGQRNELGRTLIEAIELKDNRVEAVIPQPDFAPFFQLDYLLRLGNDSTMRKRQGLVPHLRYGEGIQIRLPAAEPSKNGAKIKLQNVEEDPRPIRARHAAGKSLRKLGKAYGVSHDTVRSLISRDDV